MRHRRIICVFWQIISKLIHAVWRSSQPCRVCSYLLCKRQIISPQHGSWTINHRVHPEAAPRIAPYARVSTAPSGSWAHTPVGHSTASTLGYISVKRPRPSDSNNQRAHLTIWRGHKPRVIWFCSHHKLLIHPSWLARSLITQHPYTTTVAEITDGYVLPGRAETMCGSLPERYWRSWRASAPSLWDGRAPGKPLLEPSSRCSSFIRS